MNIFIIAGNCCFIPNKMELFLADIGNFIISNTKSCYTGLCCIIVKEETINLNFTSIILKVLLSSLVLQTIKHLLVCWRI